jgi:RNA polymerase subunit RPABC4/transcription elongation factor Spt4
MKKVLSTVIEENKIVCKKCENIISDYSAFCPYCGNEIVKKICIVCRKRIRLKYKYCPHCGKKVKKKNEKRKKRCIIS